MQNKQVAKHPGNTFARVLAPLVSQETRELVTLGRSRGWEFAVLGNAPLPSEPVRTGDWLIVPAHLDTSPVPTRSLDRIRKIHEDGLRPKGFVVVHEAPQLLAASTGEKGNPIKFSVVSPQTKETLKKVGVAIGSLAAGAVALSGFILIAVMALAAIAVLALPLVMVSGALAFDPILVAVTEDGYWVEIDRWWS